MRAIRPRHLPARRRTPSLPSWSGPLISRPAETVDEYLVRLSRRLGDSKAHLYFDTSFLMWLAKASQAARDEFNSWLSQFNPSRVHVPLWSAHEFFKHRLKRSIAAELGAEVGKFDAAATSVYQLLGQYASNELFGIESGVENLLSDYRRVIQPVRSLLAAAAKSSSFDVAVQSVAQFIDSHLLAGPLEEIISDIEADERVRNRGVVPPAFKDAHKRSRKVDAESEVTGDNSFGDLVFWREILRHAESSAASAIVVLTDDRKNDWFENHYGDAGFTESFRKLVPRPRPVPRAHPLLVREAFDRGAGELMLVDPTYCAVLFDSLGVPRENFSRAALTPSLPDIQAAPTQLRSWAGRFGPVSRMIGDADFGEGDAAVESVDPSEFVLEALKAEGLHKRTEKYLSNLKAGGDARSTALGQFKWEVLAKRDVPEIIAIGKAMFNLAEVEEPMALSILSDLREQAPTLPRVVVEPFYFGALAAAYFDEDLEYRARSGRAATSIILDLVNSSLVAEAVQVVGEAVHLTPSVYKPDNRATEVKVQVATKGSANGKAPADLLAIRVDDHELTTKTQDDAALTFAQLLGRGAGAFDTTVGSLLVEVASYFRIPRHLIVSNLDAGAIVRVPKFAGIQLEP
jgi:hypothetical protein